MVARPEKIPMSIEEYLELDRSSSDIRYEYADGYAYLMSGGTPQNTLIIGNFQGELSRQFEQKGSSYSEENALKMLLIVPVLVPTR